MQKSLEKEKNKVQSVNINICCLFVEFNLCFFCIQCYIFCLQLEELKNIPEKSKKELEQLEERKNDLEVYLFTAHLVCFFFQLHKRLI